MNKDEEKSGGDEKSSRVGLVFGGVAAVVLLLFVVQNAESTQTEFLWFQWSMPKFLLIFITVGLTLVMAVIAAWILNRRSRKG
jgi:uncharacterized integral membrane protein